MEIAFRRLRENQRPPTRTTLVHGDFRLGNLLVSPSGITGVLDWELTHQGDPAQDLGWLCTRAWRFRVGRARRRHRGPRRLAARVHRRAASPSTPSLSTGGSSSVRCTGPSSAASRWAAGSGHDALELLAVGRRVAECSTTCSSSSGYRCLLPRPRPATTIPICSVSRPRPTSSMPSAASSPSSPTARRTVTVTEASGRARPAHRRSGIPDRQRRARSWVPTWPAPASRPDPAWRLRSRRVGRSRRRRHCRGHLHRSRPAVGGGQSSLRV